MPLPPFITGDPFNPGSCCSIFVVIAFSDGSEDAEVVTSLALQPCGAAFPWVCCQLTPNGTFGVCNDLSQVAGYTAFDYLQDLINCSEPCLRDPTSQDPGADVDPQNPSTGFKCLQDWLDQLYPNATLVGYGITTACGGTVPYKKTVTCTPPMVLVNGVCQCPSGLVLNSQGQCVKIDPPVPPGLPNLAGGVMPLNPVLAGVPHPLAPDGIGFSRPSFPAPLPVHPVISAATVTATCGACSDAWSGDETEELEF